MIMLFVAVAFIRASYSTYMIHPLVFWCINYSIYIRSMPRDVHHSMTKELVPNRVTCRINTDLTSSTSRYRLQRYAA